MAKKVASFMDNKGNLHKTAEAALTADMAGVLGKIGDRDAGQVEAFAKSIIEKRTEIEKLFAEYDDMVAPADFPLSLADRL